MNYQWNVVQMDRLTSDGFVVTVHYTVNAVDGSGNGQIVQGDNKFLLFGTNKLTGEKLVYEGNK
jgi:hypothetical protein